MEIRGDAHAALDLGDRRVELILVGDVVDHVDTRDGQTAVIQHPHRRRRRMILENAALLRKRLVINIMGLDALEFEIFRRCAKFFKRNIMPAFGRKRKLHQCSHTFQCVEPPFGKGRWAIRFIELVGGIVSIADYNGNLYYLVTRYRSIIYAIPHPPKGGSSLYQREPLCISQNERIKARVP